MTYTLHHDTDGFRAVLPEGVVIVRLDGKPFATREECEEAMRLLEERLGKREEKC